MSHLLFHFQLLGNIEEINFQILLICFQQHSAFSFQELSLVLTFVLRKFFISGTYSTDLNGKSMEKRTLLEMPAEILEMIFKQVTLSDRRNVREVCSKFRDTVDNGALTRHHVVLNNTNYNAVRNLRPSGRMDTLIVEDFNRSLGSTSSTRSILSSRNVGELILAGRSGYSEKRVKTSTIPMYYPYLPNETNVERDLFNWFTSADLTKGISALNLKSIFFFTSQTITTLVMSSDVCTDLNKKWLHSLGRIQFPNLNTLEFILVHHSNGAIKKRVNSAIEAIFDWRFPSLQTIAFRSICPCNEVGINQWMKFYSCLVAHKQTLQELKLNHHFHFNIKDFMNGNETHSNSIRQLMEDLKGVTLKRLNLVILFNCHPNKFFAMRSKQIFVNSFEIQLLRSQTQLQVLKLDFGYLFFEGLFENLPTSQNLQACSIHLYGTRAEREFVNLSFLEKSKDLKKLQIVCEQDNSCLSPWKLSGVTNLPLSLEHLVISTDLTINDARWIQTHLSNLRHIQYYGGIQLGRDYQLLSQAEIEANNFAHFRDCVNTLPHLKQYRMTTSNNLITSSLNTLCKNVDFEVYLPFSCRRCQFYEQH